MGLFGNGSDSRIFLRLKGLWELVNRKKWRIVELTVGVDCKRSTLAKTFGLLYSEFINSLPYTISVHQRMNSDSFIPKVNLRSPCSFSDSKV